MKYDISNTSAPKMPTLGKGTECIQILLSQASPTLTKVLFLSLPLPFPVRTFVVKKYGSGPILKSHCPKNPSRN